MSTRTVYQPPTPHRCELKVAIGYKPAGYQRGTVEVCDDCGRVWIYDPIGWQRPYRNLRHWPFDRKVRKVLRADREARFPRRSLVTMGDIYMGGQ